MKNSELSSKDFETKRTMLIDYIIELLLDEYEREQEIDTSATATDSKISPTDQ